MTEMRKLFMMLSSSLKDTLYMIPSALLLHHLRFSLSKRSVRWLCEVARKEGVRELLIVQPRSTADGQLREAQRLAKTYSGQECETILVGRNRRFIPSASTYLGSGSVETLKERAEESSEVFVNAILTGVQVRNLEEALGVRVLDRIGLIVNIFAQRAQTKEAKLQVELACLQLAKTRLVRVMDSTGRPATFGVDGMSEVVSGKERSRGGGGQGGIGGGGQGEKEIVLQRGRILQKVRSLRVQIEAVKRTRNVHRQGRRNNSTPVVAVVGYTNAGKSTLVSKLTRSQLECDDLYFKTLDPISRRLRLSHGQFCVVSDTVGFISDLPICLFAAFRATLEEATHADLILHVIDADASNMKQQRLEVYKTLQEVGVAKEVLKHGTIEAFNKMDKIERLNGSALYLHTPEDGGHLSVVSISRPQSELDTWLDALRTEESGFCPKRVFISALSGNGLEHLKGQVEEILMKKWS